MTNWPDASPTRDSSFCSAATDVVFVKLGPFSGNAWWCIRAPARATCENPINPAEDEVGKWLGGGGRAGGGWESPGKVGRAWWIGKWPGWVWW